MTNSKNTDRDQSGSERRTESDDEPLPLVADCRDCWQTYLFCASDILEEHPHATSAGHTMAYEGVGDRLRRLGIDPGRGVATDGGSNVAEDDQLRSAAAALSGRYSLDFSVSERPGHVEASATLPCLKDVLDDLNEGSSDYELVEIGEWEIDNRSVVGTLFLQPGDELLSELVSIEREARPDTGVRQMPEDQPKSHTIDGDGTIPADATVRTRDPTVAQTLRGGDDAPHYCEGCDQPFWDLGDLFAHECEQNWGGPDPDDDTPTALADGGVDRIETAEEFLEWSFEIRGEDCLVVTNDLSGNDDRPNRAAVWSEESIDVPEGVAVETEREADGTAPAVQDRDIQGWTKYELRLAKQALADGGTRQDKQGFTPDDDYDHPRDRDVDGTLILADEYARNLQWHHATEYSDGAFHTACGREVDPDDVRDELQNPAEDWWRNVTPTNGCPNCSDSALGKSDTVAMTDGGVTVAEFQRRKNSRSSTDRDEQDRCEECGSVALEPKNPTDVDSKREHPEPYRCSNCGEHVEGSGPEPRSDGSTMAMGDLVGNRDYDGTRPTDVGCPKCGADPGDPCEFYGGKGAGEPKPNVCIARRKAARKAADTPGDRDD